MSSPAEFIELFKKTFPHDDLPDTSFMQSQELVDTRLQLCKDRIEEASRITRHERFTLNWLSDYKKNNASHCRDTFINQQTDSEVVSQDDSCHQNSAEAQQTPNTTTADPLNWPLVSPPSSRSSSCSSITSANPCVYEMGETFRNASASITSRSSTTSNDSTAAQLETFSPIPDNVRSTNETPGDVSSSVMRSPVRQFSDPGVFDDQNGFDSPKRSLSARSMSSDSDVMDNSSSLESPRPKPRARPKPLPRMPKRRPSGTDITEDEETGNYTTECPSPHCDLTTDKTGGNTNNKQYLDGISNTDIPNTPTIILDGNEVDVTTSVEKSINQNEQKIENDGNDLNINKLSLSTADNSNDEKKMIDIDEIEPSTFEHKSLLPSVEINHEIEHNDSSDSDEFNQRRASTISSDDLYNNKEDEQDARVAALELGVISNHRSKSKKKQQDDKYRVVKGMPASFDQMQDVDFEDEQIYDNYDSGSCGSGSLRPHKRAPLVRPELSDDDDSTSDTRSYNEDEEPPEPSFRHMTIEEIEKLKKWQSDEDIFQSLQRECGSGEDSDVIPSPVLKRGHHIMGPKQMKKPSINRLKSSDDEIFVEKPLEEKPEEKPCEEEETEESKSNNMRKLLVMDLVDTERCYVDCLDMLRKFMKPIQKSTETSQPILTIVDFNNIFFGVDELFRFHQSFMPQLEARVERWNNNQVIGDVLSVLMDSLDLYRAFINNFQVSKDTIMKCRHANSTFDDIMSKDIRISSLKEPIKLEGLLYKPVNRMTQYSLILNDFLKSTSDSHPDHALLVEVTANLFDLFEQVNISRDKKGATQRHFLKEGFVVELDSDGERKARHLLLYSDCLICAKLKPSKDSFVCKWYAALADLHLKPSELSEAPQTVPVTTKVECDRLRASICNLRVELKKEQLPLVNVCPIEGSPPVMKRRKEGSFSASNAKVNNRVIEKIKRKLQEQENLLKLIAPSLPWTLYHRNGKTVTLLLLNEGERHAWKEVLIPRIKKMVSRGQTNFSLNNAELQSALEECLKIQRFSARFANALPTPYFESRNSTGGIATQALTGYLYVHIISGKGFRNSDTYCVLEVDCYNNFFRKAKTKSCKGPEPQWDEGFKMQLESALCLRLVCYNRIRLMLDDVCGKVTIDLNRENLKDGRQHQVTVSLDKQGSVTLALTFSTNPDDIEKESMSTDVGVFGVPIEVVARRERNTIPLIVITCVKEIDKRGINEVGIYRLSGISSEIVLLKKSFNENPQSAMVDVAEADIHAIAGLLKSYFRELPDPLFTSDLYSKLLEAANISDVEEKDLYLCQLIQQLPETNRLTTLFLMEHLRRVAENSTENKMNLNNLATVFGPNVLRPGAEADNKKKAEKQIATFGIGALDVMSQVSIFRAFLTSKSKHTRLPEDNEIIRRLYPEKYAPKKQESIKEIEDRTSL